MLLVRPLDDILSSGTKVAILRLLCSAAGPWSGRQIARETGLSSSNCARACRELVTAGVAEARQIGNCLAYRLAETETPLVKRLCELFREEDDRREATARALAERIPGVLSLILFGSEARGDTHSTSDTDLLVVVRERNEDLDSEIDWALFEETAKQGLHASWLIAGPEDIGRWERDRPEFWRNVIREGKTLAGESIARLQRRYGHLADTMGEREGVLGGSPGSA